MNDETTNGTVDVRDEVDRMEGEIRAYEQLLAQSDYQALKQADGALSDEEYAETRVRRAQWRQAINDLRAKEQALLDPPAVSGGSADSNAAESTEQTA